MYWVNSFPVGTELVSVLLGPWPTGPHEWGPAELDAVIPSDDVSHKSGCSGFGLFWTETFDHVFASDLEFFDKLQDRFFLVFVIL